MLRSLAFQVLCAVVLFCAAAVAQQPESQLPDAPQQQPQAQPPQAPPPPPPSDEQPKEEKKPESKIKRTLKRGAPNCIQIGGAEKCKAPSTDDDEAGSKQPAPQQPKLPSSQPLPRSSNPEESSSKDSVPLTPPAGEEGSAPASDVQELHPYNPHKADKNVEVGDFYFKRNNYRAAASRYAEALDYMPNHAVATYKLAEAQDKLGKTAQARANYEKYLKILPSGEFAGPAKAALARLDAQAKESPPTSPPAQKRR
jgi:tetratricopeptide (TPR) repeat protein